MLALRRSLRPASLSLRAGVRASSDKTHGHSGKPEEIEAEKLKNLKGESESPVEHAPKWNDKLASDAEAKVKAEKDPRGPEQLQKDTAAKHAKEQK